MNDKASSLYGISYYIGCSVAPVLGGFLNECVEFRYTCDIMAFAALIMSIFYFFISFLPKYIKDKKYKLKLSELFKKQTLLTIERLNDSL